MIVTDEQIRTYDRDGTVLIPGAFDDWVAHIEAAVKDVIAEHRSGALDLDAGAPSTQNDLNIVENFGGGAMALNIFPYHAGFQEWLDESPAARMAAEIMQSKTARYWIDATFWKEEGAASEGTPWHNDTCTWPFWGRQMTILWIALTDVDEGNGPMITVRGTHDGDGRYYSTFFPQDIEPPEPYRPWQELMDQALAPDAEIQTWTMKKGDCLFMHPSTIHGSKPRSANAGVPRLAFSTRWLGDDVVWKPDPLTARMTEKLTDHPDMTFNAPPAVSAIPVSWTHPSA